MFSLLASAKALFCSGLLNKIYGEYVALETERAGEGTPCYAIKLEEPDMVTWMVTNEQGAHLTMEKVES